MGQRALVEAGSVANTGVVKEVLLDNGKMVRVVLDHFGRAHVEGTDVYVRWVVERNAFLMDARYQDVGQLVTIGPQAIFYVWAPPPWYVCN